MTRTITTDPGAPPPTCSIHGTPMKSKGLYRGRAHWLCEITHKVDIHSDPLRPWCLKCRRPLKKSSSARASNWVCSSCGACMVRRRQRRRPTYLKRPSRYQLQMPVEIVARPACLRCRREMWIKAAVNPTGRRHFLWLCGTCNRATVVARGRWQYLPHIPSRPNCPRCSGPMYRAGKYSGRQNWLCLPCRISTVRPEVYLSIRDPAGRPPCPRCSHTMRKDGTRHGRQCWLCPACERTMTEKPIPVLHTPPQLDDAAALDLLTALSA
jgi:transposase-like protein